jgi:glucokinase
MDLLDNNLFTLGVDLGGTKIDTAMVDGKGNILSSHYRLINPARDPDFAIHEIVDSVRICVEKSGKHPSALGLGVAGQIDKQKGIVRVSPNLPSWSNFPVCSRLSDLLQIPVVIDNDVRVITMGEWKYGSGRGINNLVCLFVGTGVGGGIVSQGHLIEGFNNTAGELGHIPVVAAGRKCSCPGEGCLEAYVGGWAIAQRAQEAVQANPAMGQTLIAMAGNVTAISAITVSKAYSAGDPLAHRLIKDTAKFLSAGLVTIVNALNPQLIILGGSVVQGIPDLLTQAEVRVRLSALQPAVQSLRISLGSLGNKAGVIGGAAMARDLLI